MSLIPEWAPNIHPILVHFPIALLFFAVVMNLMNLFLPADWWSEKKSTITYGAGTLMGIITYYTGTLAADSVFLPTEAQNILNEHSEWAWWTVWFFTAYVLARIVIHQFNYFKKRSVRVGALVLVLPGIFMLYETGDHGAEMVFGYGVGTGQLLEKEPPSTLRGARGESRGERIENRFTLHENGWSWTMGNGAVSTLIDRFHWIEGSVKKLNPSVLKSEGYFTLQFQPDGSNSFLVTDSKYNNVQVDYYLDMSEFDGSIQIVHNVQDIENYNYVQLTSGGTISQGRVVSGRTEQLAEANYNYSGMMFVRVVANGTHFRAYIDREMIVHSHGKKPEIGGVGMKINGTGRILIDKIDLSQLD